MVVAAASVNSGTVSDDLCRSFAIADRIACQPGGCSTPVRGQAVEVNMSDTTDTPVKARIEFIAPLAIVKNNIKGFEVQALIEDTEDRLKPGMSVSMNVPVGAAQHAVSVPVSAVFKDSKQNVVYVRKGGSTEKRKVTVGVNNLSYRRNQIRPQRRRGNPAGRALAGSGEVMMAAGH